MKLNKLNYISEDQQIAKLVTLIEDVFSGSDLDDIARHSENLLGGIEILEKIAKGGSDVADQMSYDDIELAAAAFKRMNSILRGSKDSLIEQLKINQLTQKKKPDFPVD